MKKLLLLLLFCFEILTARENPFTPLDQKPDFAPALDIQKRLDVFKEVKIPEPVKVVPITKKEIKAKPIVKKKITKVIKKKSLKTKVSKKRKTSKLLYHGNFSKIKYTYNQIKIYTKDAMLQNFKLNNPYRLVFDFERFDVLKPYTKKINSKKLKSLKVGHHDYFYRTVFTLRKSTRYRVKKTSYGYLITLF